jgi:hypothetical protein
MTDGNRETNNTLRLNEWEAAQLARAVEQLAEALGFPPEDVDRSYQDSYAFFLQNTQ